MSTTSDVSSFFSPPASTVIVTESLPTFTLPSLAPVRTSIFRFLKARSTSFEQSASSTGRMFGITSTRVTCDPKAAKTSANSQPTAPAPTMVIVFGAFSRISASSDESTVFLFSSRPIWGRPFTRDPVEMTIAFLASCLSSFPSVVVIATLVAGPPAAVDLPATIFPVPRIHVILFFLKRNSTPLVFWVLTARERFIATPKSSFTSPGVTPNSAAFFICSA